MTVQVWRRELLKAAGTWSDQGDELYTAKKNLKEIDTALLGSRVAPSAQAFITTWAAEIQALRDRAEDHSAALTSAAATWLIADDTAQENAQKLLPWDQRDLTSRPTGPYWGTPLVSPWSTP